MAISRSQMKRQLYMGGGITTLPINEMMVPRGQYGLGSIVKSVTKGITGAVKGAVNAVKDVASSDIGKLALLAAGGYYLGGLGGATGFGRFAPSAMKAGLLGTVEAGTGLYGGGLLSGFMNSPIGQSLTGGALSNLIPGKGTLLSAGLGFLGGAATSMLTPQQIETGMKRNPTAVRAYLAQYYKNLNPEATEEEAEQYANEQTREYAAQGGIMGIPMGQPRKNQQGVQELDYRQEGGFVPVGIKEKADDVPAMLSKNEFVFTADAVRGAGNGDVEKGAERLYNTMKTLENGGTV